MVSFLFRTLFDVLTIHKLLSHFDFAFVDVNELPLAKPNKSNARLLKAYKQLWVFGGEIESSFFDWRHEPIFLWDLFIGHRVRIWRLFKRLSRFTAITLWKVNRRVNRLLWLLWAADYLFHFSFLFIVYK